MPGLLYGFELISIDYFSLGFGSHGLFTGLDLDKTVLIGKFRISWIWITTCLFIRRKMKHLILCDAHSFIFSVFRRRKRK